MSEKRTIEFTDSNFDTEVLQSDVPVLVDFWADWCGPCRAVGPAIDQLIGEFATEAKVGKLNVDENPETAERYKIVSIPAVLVFSKGQMVESLMGVRPKERYSQALQKVLAAA